MPCILVDEQNIPDNHTTEIDSLMKLKTYRKVVIFIM